MALSTTNKEILEKAVNAIHERIFHAQYPEHPKAYSEEASAKGKEAFDKKIGQPFDELLQENPESYVGEEVSPFTEESLGIQYPAFSVDTFIVRSGRAFSSWKKVDIEQKAEVLMDCLEAITDRFFEIAFATMHTTGQSFMMSFQASGPHSNDRALEAMALAYEELKRFPQKVLWEKPMGKISVKLEKTFKPVPKGISLAIGCSTFPVWNTIPGVFASLMTGNTVIVKPHPKAVLPIAIVVGEMQKVLKAKGYDPLVIQLAADRSQELITKKLAEHPLVKIIDYTGGSQFGEYIETLRKTVFTEKAGVNSAIIDSTDNLESMMQNLAFAVSLYSGQMCTAPQNFFIPKEGIKVGENQVSYDEVVDALKNAIDGLVNHPKMGAGTLGAIQSDMTMKRISSAEDLGARVVLGARKIENPEFLKARVSAPTILEVDAKDVGIYENEMFGPIIMVVKTTDTNESIEVAKDMATRHGAITCAAYSTDPATIEKIEEEMSSAFAPVSLNLTGPIWVNQHAAFSDFHVTGGNPAGNASFTNPDFVNRRFVWVGNRKIAE
ncbi:MAG: phenylacetic acid degradation protein PaaN [Chitinophagales bacterium]|nr:phenylacetic acid degradation protein PaaN [Chitinophagales bacterium]